MKKQPLKEKLKAIGGGHLLNESNVWDRKFGEKLPTLADTASRYAAKQNKVNEASYSPKHVKRAIDDMKDWVNKLVKQGEDYELFQSAKSSAKALKQIQKLLKQVG